MQEKLYSPKEVAEKLGINYRTVLNRVNEGAIRIVRLGKNFYVPESAIESYLNKSESIQPLQVAISLVVKGSDVLLVKRQTPEDKLVWQFPAGRIRYAEKPTNRAEKAVLNETGIYCKVQKRLGKRVQPDTRVIAYYFLCEYVTGELENIDKEQNSSAIWVSKEKVLTLLTSNVFEPIRKVLAN
jgi:excisionase family DNA binding protein